MATCVPILGDHSRYELSNLDVRNGFPTFMEQARGIIAQIAARGEGNILETYTHITQLGAPKLLEWLSKPLDKEERIKMDSCHNLLLNPFWGSDEVKSEIREGILVYRRWLTSVYPDMSANLRTDLALVEGFVRDDLNALPNGEKAPENVLRAVGHLRNAEVDGESRSLSQLALSELATDYTSGRSTWGPFAETVLDVHKLFVSMYPNGVVLDGVVDDNTRHIIQTSLPTLAGILTANLPENHLPVDLKDWQLPGCKKVSNLKQIWANPTLKGLARMVQKTAALFLRFLKGTYSSWKIGRLARKNAAAEDRGELWGLLAKGYDLQWRRGSTSPEEFSAWLSDLSHTCENNRRQFPKLEAALSSGVLFPRQGEHFNPEDFRPFLKANQAYPSVETMSQVRERMKGEVAGANNRMQDLANFFERSRGFKGEPDLDRFKEMADGLLNACIFFEGTFKNGMSLRKH